MFFAYRVFTTLLYPFLIFFIYFRMIKKKEDSTRFKEKIFISHFKVKRNEKSKLIWFHAASLGEFKSILPIINQLNKNDQNLNFLITTSTFSSGNLAKLELKKINNTEHRYFPFDVPFLIRKFICLWKPSKIFLVDSEIWPNLIYEARKNKIQLSIINARLTAKSFKRWMLFPKVAKKIFKFFDLFICSNTETKEYLEKLNLENIYFKGNIKLAAHIDEAKLKNFNENFLLKKRFWFAASIHKEEDLFCIKTHLTLREKFKDIVTIIAPRHIERSIEIESLAKKFNLNSQILNKNEIISENKELIIVNYFGALPSYFKYSKSVFIGKSMISKLKSQGGQNPIEAAKLDCKIYHGPYVYNFKDIYKILEKNNISKKIENHEELVQNLIEDFKDIKKQTKEKRNLINELGDETFKETMKLIENFLDDKDK